MITCNHCGEKIETMRLMGDHIAETGHRNYRTEDGIDVPPYIPVVLMAGAMWCTTCGEHFTNNYRYYEHLERTQHEKEHGMGQHYKSEKLELDELEQKWFYGRDQIAYQRLPRPDQDGNTLVQCPRCEQIYKSGLFIDADPRKWKPDTHWWMLSCPRCGQTTNTPNQNIYARQDVYEVVIGGLRDENKTYREKFGGLSPN